MVHKTFATDAEDDLDLVTSGTLHSAQLQQITSTSPLSSTAPLSSPPIEDEEARIENQDEDGKPSFQPSAGTQSMSHEKYNGALLVAFLNYLANPSPPKRTVSFSSSLSYTTTSNSLFCVFVLSI